MNGFSRAAVTADSIAGLTMGGRRTSGGGEKCCPARQRGARGGGIKDARGETRGAHHQSLGCDPEVGYAARGAARGARGWAP